MKVREKTSLAQSGSKKTRTKIGMDRSYGINIGQNRNLNVRNDFKSGRSQDKYSQTIKKIFLAFKCAVLLTAC